MPLEVPRHSPSLATSPPKSGERSESVPAHTWAARHKPSFSERLLERGPWYSERKRRRSSYIKETYKPARSNFKKGKDRQRQQLDRTLELKQRDIDRKWRVPALQERLKQERNPRTRERVARDLAHAQERAQEEYGRFAKDQEQAHTLWLRTTERGLYQQKEEAFRTITRDMNTMWRTMHTDEE
ncbi:MAG: hypothetical protein WEA04_05065 [Candidatus Andersenbacteria bacterium]